MSEPENDQNAKNGDLFEEMEFDNVEKGNTVQGHAKYAKFSLNDGPRFKVCSVCGKVIHMSSNGENNKKIIRIAEHFRRSHGSGSLNQDWIPQKGD